MFPDVDAEVLSLIPHTHSRFIKSHVHDLLINILRWDHNLQSLQPLLLDS